MCGILGFATQRAAITSQARCNFMEQGLYVNGLRGQHATGVFYGDVDNTVWWAKDAVDARTFLTTQGYNKIVSGFDKNTTFCVGHNRFATMGEHTQDDAHPFFQGSVAMVHNGTLRSYKSLGTPVSGTSDSAHICAALADAEPGDTNVIESLDGDFALVWHDRRDNALRVATNGRRPLCYTTNFDNMFFASEAGMLQFLVNRTAVGTNSKDYPITDFEPFKMYTLQVGSIEWKLTDFEDQWTSHYTTSGRAGNYYPPHRDPYSWEESAYYDAYGMAEDPAPFELGAPKVTKGKGKKNKNILLFPTESRKSSSTRVGGCNRLMRDWGLDCRAGDSMIMELESERFYGTNENTKKSADDRKGQAEGFWYYNEKRAGEMAFFVTVHQCPMDKLGRWTDTIKGQLANAYVDADGDLHLVLIYQHRMAHRIPVADGSWSDELHKFFKGDRWLYTDDDKPRFSWLDTNMTLTAREVDMLLDGEYCQIESCHIPVNMVPRSDIVFTEPTQFVCRDCTAHSIQVTNGKVEVKSEVQAVLDQTQKLLASPTTIDGVDMEEQPPGSGKFVLSLPHKNKEPDKPNCHVDGFGVWRNSKTGEIIKDKEGNPILVTH